MSVYNLARETLQNIYDVDGNKLSYAYDADGNEIYRAGKIPGYAIENVQDYYRPRTLEVAEQINGLSDQWQSFVFLTDPHYPTTEMHSQAISLYLLSNCPGISMLVLGGDYCEGNWNKSRFNTWTAEFRASENRHFIHCLFGNHERFGGGLEDALSTIYSSFIADKLDEVSGNPQQNYYYFDVPSHKTRFVLINTSDSGTTVISETQLAWIREVGQLPDSTWSLVVLGHINMMVGVGLLENRADLIDAITSSNGEIVGYICGHQHTDAINQTSGLYEATLLCDRLENTTYYERIADTTSEQAVSVVSINTSSKDVVIRRIGAGSQQFGYSYA